MLPYTLKHLRPITLMLLALAMPSTAEAATRIPISAWMITNEVAQGDASLLFDEQGDPAAGLGGKPSKSWFPGWSSWYYPAGVVVDLGAVYNVSQIYLYDTSGTGNVSFETGTPFQWKPLFTDPQTTYLTWIGHNVTVQTRYVHIVVAGPSAIPAEVVMYGTPVSTPIVEPAPVPPHPSTMDGLIGADAFVDDPPGLLKAVGQIREYHDWTWDEGNGGTYPGYPGNLNKFNPSYSGGWDFDQFYANINGLGDIVAPDLQGSVPWLTAGGVDKPIPAGADPTKPASYAAHADHMFQMAARYGTTKVADSVLKLGTDQPRVSGLNSVKFYENWNEENKWWSGRTVYFTPYEFAAMCSADFDGHLGTMGKTFGIKNADTNSALAMGGLAESTVDYVKAMKLWFDFNRGGSIPISVINVHHYSTDSGGQGGTATTGISPEDDHLKDRLTTIVDYRNRFMQKAKVWLSEFGYDTNPGSPFHAPAIGSATAEETQADWIVRSFLAVAAAGVDKAQVFMLRDVDATSTTQFSSSGLTSSKATGWVPKASWYYVYTMKNQLMGKQFDAEIPSGDPRVSIYRFKTATATTGAYVVWCPTSNGTTVSGFSLPLRTGETSATGVTLTKGVRDGVSQKLTVSGGKVAVNVSERPYIVLVANAKPAPKPYKLDNRLTLTKAMVTNESGIGDATMLVDEQAIVGNPAMGQGGAPTTQWFGGWDTTKYPVNATIDLGQVYPITQIYLRDMSSAANVIVSTGTPGAWTSLFTDDLRNYANWNAHVSPVSTRYLRVTLTSPSANISEIAVYTN